MREVLADMWTLQDELAPDVFTCITTNNTVADSGAAVMGAGVALGARMRYPGIQFELARLIKNDKYDVRSMWKTDDGATILNFPVKYEVWKPATIELVQKSVDELVVLAGKHPKATFILPRPGCGVGGLTWEEVKPICERLPDNVWVIDLPPRPKK